MAAINNQPDFQILICLIQIWKLEDPKNPMETPPHPKLIAEVEEIEIEDSYRKLIGTASVKFPRGTVIKETVTEVNRDKISKKNPVSAQIDHGILVTTRSDSKLAETSDFNVGDRIRIMLGYTVDPEIAALAKVNGSGKSIFNDGDKLKKYKAALTTMFDGYITQCSVTTPIELKCENLASNLKKISCPKLTSSGKNMTVNDVLSSKGKWKLLKDTGFELDPETESMEIDVGPIKIPPDLTVADVLVKWGNSKVFAYYKEINGKPCISVGRSYFSGAGKDSVVNKNTDRKIPKILFNYNVAEDGLSLTQTDKAFLAVEAQAMNDNIGKAYRITVRKNPDTDTSKKDYKPYQVLSEITLSAKAQRMGAMKLKAGKDKIDLNQYTIIPYMSRKIGISHESLLEEAIKYLESYNMNGIEGQLTLFGDHYLKSASKVELVDSRFKGRNGYYLVDEVTTKFGVHGFRQTIKLPYLIAKIKEENEQQI
ncbi:MAG: hypothetical protein LBK58_15920 [Prevotellaceae bacterium]|jgi:hypothetical protein|nr:hypothetical protein [Prevotellaceae bacterium]